MVKYCSGSGHFPDASKQHAEAYPDEEAKNKFYEECVRQVDRIRSVLDNPADVTDDFRLERIDEILNGE